MQTSVVGFNLLFLHGQALTRTGVALYRSLEVQVPFQQSPSLMGLPANGPDLSMEPGEPEQVNRTQASTFMRRCV